MSRQKSAGRAVDALLRSVVSEAIQGLKGSLPSPSQVRKIEKRLSRLDRRISTLMRLSGKAPGSVRQVGRPRENPEFCTVHGCRGAARARKLCSRHYQQRRRTSLARKK